MSMAAKVLWGEGLFLRPPPFQRQDQYHEARLHHTARALHPYLWGVARMACAKRVAAGVPAGDACAV